MSSIIKVAITTEDIIHLTLLVSEKHPHLLESLPAFVEKVCDSSSQLSEHPSSELDSFTEDEKAILCLWILNQTPDEQSEDELKKDGKDEPKNKSMKNLRSYGKTGIRTLERHLLIQEILNLIREHGQDIIHLFS